MSKRKPNPELEAAIVDVESLLHDIASDEDSEMTSWRLIKEAARTGAEMAAVVRKMLHE